MDLLYHRANSNGRDGHFFIYILIPSIKNFFFYINHKTDLFITALGFLDILCTNLIIILVKYFRQLEHFIENSK